MAELTMVEAINLALKQEMDRDDRVIVSGEDVGGDEGIFRVTADLLDDFGERRVIDTPLAESGILGVGIGMAAAGLRPVCEIQFSGFNYLAYHQLESHASRLRWRSRGRFTCPLVARMPYGAGVRALEHHSESKEVIYTHVPGLKMVVPSGPRSARALLIGAIRDPDPVVFFEPKLLYRSFREEVPDGEEVIKVGEIRREREGGDLTVIAYGAMLPRTLEAMEELAESGDAEAEVYNLLTLSPLNLDGVCESVRKTGRVLIVHEAHRGYGPAGEFIARILEKSFYHLEAPIERVAGFDTPPPYFARERDYLPRKQAILGAARGLLAAQP